MAAIEKIAAVYTEVLGNRMGHDLEVNGSIIKIEFIDDLVATIRLYESDPEYLHLNIAFNRPEPEIPVEKLREICNTATVETKVAKAGVDEDGDLVFSVEMIVAGPDLLPTAEHLQAVLPRAIQALLGIVQKTLLEVQFASESA